MTACVVHARHPVRFEHSDRPPANRAVHEPGHRTPGRGCRLTDEAVRIDLVDQDGGCLLRAARGDGVDDAEGLKEGIDDVDHQEKEGGWRQQRQRNVPENMPAVRAIDLSSLIILSGNIA